jgi:competence protein CoiA
VLYALTNGRKERASPGQAGVCPGCGAPMVAKCGVDVAWHWAHKAGSDCDPWSEPIGPWHLSWQDLVRVDSVEVPRGPHRADIVGNGDMIVELQHSPLDPAEIQERERFYGTMVWLFDATYRFRSVETGPRAFFSLGRVKHIQHCTKPVFLDFGSAVVEVEHFTEWFDKCSGFGTKRDRQWFVSQFLSEKVQGGSIPPTWGYQGVLESNPWAEGAPYRTMEHRTKWQISDQERERVFARGTKYLPLNYGWKQGQQSRPVSDYVIELFPALANGWTQGSLSSMRQFLSGTVMIFDGSMRILPATATDLQSVAARRAAQDLLQEAEDHIRAGRIPVLKPETKRLLLDRAKQAQLAREGPLLSYRARPPRIPDSHSNDEDVS